MSLTTFSPRSAAFSYGLVLLYGLYPHAPPLSGGLAKSAKQMNACVCRWCPLASGGIQSVCLAERMGCGAWRGMRCPLIDCTCRWRSS